MLQASDGNKSRWFSESLCARFLVILLRCFLQFAERYSFSPTALVLRPDISVNMIFWPLLSGLVLFFLRSNMPLDQLRMSNSDSFEGQGDEQVPIIKLRVLFWY